MQVAQDPDTPRERPEGRIGLATLDGRFPMDPGEVEQHHDVIGFQRCVKRFEHRRGWYTAECEGFPETIEEERVCRGGNCCKGLLCEKKDELDWVSPKQEK